MPEIIFWIYKQNSIYGQRCHRGAEGVVGTGAQPSESDVADTVAIAYELDRSTNIFKRYRGKDLIFRLPGALAAVTETRKIHAKYDIPATRPAPRKRNIQAIGANMVVGTRI